jgi:hypothetical protein
MDRFEVRKVKGRRAWRVFDTVTGHIHSAEIADKARAESQARTMSAKHEEILRRNARREIHGTV